MGPEPRGPLTKGAQGRAWLAEALLRRGTLFHHLRPLPLPWRGSQGAAPAEAEREVAEGKEEEPAGPGEAGEAPVAEGMDVDTSEREGLPPEDEEMNTLRGTAQVEGNERAGLAHGPYFLLRGVQESYCICVCVWRANSATFFQLSP